MAKKSNETPKVASSKVAPAVKSAERGKRPPTAEAGNLEKGKSLEKSASGERGKGVLEGGKGLVGLISSVHRHLGATEKGKGSAEKGSAEKGSAEKGKGLKAVLANAHKTLSAVESGRSSQEKGSAEKGKRLTSERGFVERGKAAVAPAAHEKGAAEKGGRVGLERGKRVAGEIPPPPPPHEKGKLLGASPKAGEHGATQSHQRLAAERGRLSHERGRLHQERGRLAAERGTGGATVAGRGVVERGTGRLAGERGHRNPR